MGRYLAAVGPFVIGSALGVAATPMDAIRWVALVPLAGLLLVPFIVETLPADAGREPGPRMTAPPRSPARRPARMATDDGRLRSSRRSPRPRSRHAHRCTLRGDAARRPRRRRHQGGAAGAGRLHAYHRAVRERLLALLGGGGTRQALGDARSPQARRAGVATTTRAARRRRGGELPARHPRIVGTRLR